ncbi:MAG: DUF11 domain-containing protein [Acidobacteriota bacterium]
MPIIRQHIPSCVAILLVVLAASSVRAADPGLPGLEKTGPATALAGEQFNYVLTALNPSSQEVTVSDTLPTGTTFVSIQVSLPNWVCLTPAVGANGPVTCTRSPGPIPESTTFTIRVRVCTELSCPTVLSNVGLLVTNNLGVITTVNSNTITTTISAQSDVSITKTGPATAPAGTDVTYTLNFANAGPSNSAGTTVTDVLPPGWSIVSASPSVGTCLGIGLGTLNCNLGILGAANQCQSTAPTSGTITVVAHVPAVTPPGQYTNTATIASANCLPDPNLANNTSTSVTTVTQVNLGPGEFYPSGSAISDTKAGSVLFYNFYISDPADPASSNSRISITNTNPFQGVLLHLFFVDGATCSAADRFLCLTANHTISFLMSDIDPGTSGYLVVVAVDGAPGSGGIAGTGCPISFNHLIGSASVKLSFSPRREDELEAESCAAEYGSPLPGCTGNNVTATLNFDGSPTGYNRLPRVLAADSIGSRADGNDTFLIINRIGGDLTRSGTSLGGIFGILYDDAEQPHSFNFNANGCQFRGSLTNALPRTSPRFEDVIPAGSTGWMKFWAAADAGILGATFNRNDNKAISGGAFEGAHNLHKLRFVPTVSLIVPVIPPFC